MSMMLYAARMVMAVLVAIIIGVKHGLSEGFLTYVVVMLLVEISHGAKK